MGRSGTYCFVKSFYPADYRFGDSALSDACAGRTVPLSAFTPEDSGDRLPLSKMLFLDTETTGLGGSGAVAFLVGCGRIARGGFEVRQYLLPDYVDEAGMLEDILGEFSSETTLVSYNGAAFDLPVLRDRMIVNRVARSIEHHHHIDLLHPSRRLFRRRLKDCRLSNIEVELFGFVRENDVPGYLVPAIYFDWLSTENAGAIPPVLEHNRNDIVSLLFLTHRIAEIYRTEGENLDNIDDLHSLARVYGRRKKPVAVKKIFGRIDSVGQSRLPADIVLYHSLNLKRTDNYEEAVSLWLSLAEVDSKEAFWANIELAKFYEHREKNLTAALRHANRARDLCPYPGQKKPLGIRLRRLSRKMRN
ncbi:MAG: ribonuclease H-like domain-containing protein [Candidatus Zixiibacteriota bacterium]|nr:MAG: ribonuclease H-like domain-containing protein [candidate division Zixibacteria bacterium]